MTAIFPKLLGLIYIIAFGGHLFQIRGLLGKNGILPIDRFLNAYRYLGKKRFYFLPTLFWINRSDFTLMAVPALGTLCGFFLLFHLAPDPLLILIAYICQLSLLHVGQDFMGFGWEIYLCDISFTTFFLLMTDPPDPLFSLNLNLILFRCYFQGGASKLLSRDPNWRNLTAVAYHYQTQPLPNTIAYFAHKLPLSFQKVSCVLMFFAELVAPFGIFGTEEIRFVTFFIIAGLQLLIYATGNFSFLNHMTFVLSTILLFPLFPTSSLNLFLSPIGAALVLLQLISLRNYFFPVSPIAGRLLRLLSPLQIISRFGIFAVMTTKRFEVIIEGSDDRIHWKEYTFRFKPSELTRRPKRVSPYQPRLDWMAWFLPFRPYESQFWFHQFLERLLQGKKEVLQLLKYNPFQERPPKYIRALFYDYTFTDFKTWKETGRFWNRTLIGPYSPVLTLED